MAWDHLPRVDRLEAAALRAAAAWATARDPAAWRALDEAVGGALGATAPVLTAGGVEVVAASVFAAMLARAPVAAVLLTGSGGGVGAVVLDAPLAVALIAEVFRADAVEFAAPRGLSPAEQGALVALVAAGVAALASDELSVAGVVSADELYAALDEPRVVVFAAQARVGRVTGGVRFVAGASWLHAAAAPAVRTLPAWLAAFELDVALVRGLGSVAPVELAALASGDVVLFADGAPRLVVGRGAYRVVLDAGAVRVASGFQPGDHMSQSIDASLARELPVELACELARLRLTVAELAELGPGAVLPLGVAIGGAVRLVAGGRSVAHGELVDLDGELGFRVVTLG